MADLSAELYGNPQQPIAPPTGEEFLKQLPPNLASMVKTYASGKMPISPMMVRSPAGMQLLSAISQYDPSFDSTDYNARNKLRSDFTSGKSAQNLNAFNTVTQHLGDLQDSFGQLHNTSIPLVNSIKNWGENAIGQAAPNTFDLNKKAVVDELTRAWRGSGGSEGDIQSWSAVLNNSQSPEQFNSAMAKVSSLLQGKIDAMKGQYETGMGSFAKETSPQWLTPKAEKAMQSLSGNAPPTDGNANTSASTGQHTGAPSGNAPPTNGLGKTPQAANGNTASKPKSFDVEAQAKKSSIGAGGWSAKKL